MSATKETVLVFRSAALGDFILAAPALRMLKQTWPQARVVLLTMQSSNKAIRDSVAQYSPKSAIPWVDFVMPHLVDDVIFFDGTSSISSLLTLRRRMKDMHIDRSVLLLDPGAPWIGRLKKIAFIRFVVGWVPVLGWRGLGSINGDRARLKANGLLPHHVHGPMQFLKELSTPQTYKDEDIVFDLRVAPADQTWAARWWRTAALLGQTVVAFAPGSVQPHKRWPLAKFVALGTKLLGDQPDLRIVVVGTPSDLELGDELVSALGLRVTNIAGKTSVGQLAALLERCALLVGNDGGAMHLGDAMGCKVVAIVPGIEYPDSIEPWGNRRFAVRHSVPCAPCYNFTSCPLGHNKCMTELPLNTVLAKCRQQLVLNRPEQADTAGLPH